ncbi:MAG: twin-arginine translocation signal domain-containing protein [Gammaproteobacteria bacterium]|nr:twin-arginine translocation signal domain-containing protein [Gammaproteobacteria bacterium]MDH5650302.1 twin-arginine translocation signal domain-containing protein [Gammaproteobacteria bacterium]
MHRRDFMKLSGAGIASTVIAGTGLIGWLPRAHAATINKTFYITQGLATMIDGTSVFFKGFSSSPGVVNVPGEMITTAEGNALQEGDTVNLTIHNTLSTSHNFTIDGVVDKLIPANQSLSFSFTVNAWGSYLYYDSSNAPYNRLVGLHGAMPVMPAGLSNQLYPGSHTFVQQYSWIFNDIDPVWHEAVRNGQTPTSAYKPRYFTLNGLGGRPPGAPGAHDPNIDAITDPRSALYGHVGDRTLCRMINVGLADQSVHAHGNHMEWLTLNGQVRPEVWTKDCLYLESKMGKIDSIYPFESPPDAWPSVTKSTYPMHLHTEMSQTAAGGYYMFGAMTDIYFE